MPGLFEQSGSQSPKPPKYAPLFISSLWEGLWTNRNILQSPGSLYETKYLGGRPGAMSGGQNVEMAQEFGPLEKAPDSHPLLEGDPVDELVGLVGFTGPSGPGGPGPREPE